MRQSKADNKKHAAILVVAVMLVFFWRGDMGLIEAEEEDVS